jgi:GNAT superfamily N-acetyltransferase
VIAVRPVPFDDPAVIAMTGRLEAELLDTYDGVPGSGGLPAAEVFLPPAGAFVVAEVDNEPAACGGYGRLDDETAEVRRMFVDPAMRGRGLGRTVLAEIERLAADAGYTRIRLETGNLQHAAVALYERSGYRRIPCWGPFVDDPKSVCFEKTLPGS